MANGTYKLLKQDASGNWNEVNILAENGKVLGFDSSLNPVMLTTSGGSSTPSIWVEFTGTRTSNTTFTLTGNQTSIFSKGLIIKWLESTTIRCGMVVSSTYSSVTTVTIIGDICDSIATHFKYCMLEVEVLRFVLAGTIGATATSVANKVRGLFDYRILGADLNVDSAGTTGNTTIDINLAGITMFTTKPTLATTVSVSPTPFTADNNTSSSANNEFTIDIDAKQDTPAVGLYVHLYVFQTRLLKLS